MWRDVALKHPVDNIRATALLLSQDPIQGESGGEPAFYNQYLLTLMDRFVS
jgi:hypothetical protein